MRFTSLHIFLAFFLVLFSFSGKGQLQNAHKEDHIKVSLRMIGHELLLSSGDSTSRVLPILWQDSIYGIEFESDFVLSTEDLASIVKRVAKKNRLALNYTVEVQTTDPNAVVYSFQSNQEIASDIIPCGGRNYPEDNYRILFKIIEPFPIQERIIENSTTEATIWPFILIGIVILFLIGFLILKKRKAPVPNKVGHIHVGIYQFNQNTGLLLLNDEKIQLTNKESDLLNLLFQHKNATVEREVILNAVWGDEGDYVGRTLDVFISKLRKKLEADEKVKISNVRGVGYKLILE